MSSDSDEENKIRYGTPLEPYEEDEIPSKRKYQQPPDQFAVDAHGRRRFHGAFTGGFSAGWGNSVGTPEGWTPATFKSSKAEKAQISSRKPEDFMDEEDRGEFGIAPKQLQTHSEFTGQKRPRQRQFHDGPIPGEPVLQELVRAVHETAAVKLLRRMGWRPGQGAGERLTRREKKQNEEQRRVYGCYMPPEYRQDTEKKSDSDSTDSEFEYDTLFAPDDYEPYVLARKNDRFGLGYTALSRHSVLGNLVGEYGSDAGTSRSHLVMKDKGKKVSIRGQAFGVGAFEADDEDIYATEDMSHYDFTLGGAAHKDHKIQETRKGNNVLEGFVRASKPMSSVPSYPPPALPRDYKPLPAGMKRTRFEPTELPQRDQGLGRHELTSEARGALLGEVPLPPLEQDPPKTATNPAPPLNIIVFGAEEKLKNTPDFISIKDSGKELTKVFKPFVGNPQKQFRYEQYLKDKDLFVKESDGNIDRVSEWERNRELLEFEQAAKLYRPLTGEMGDRFTHATEPDEGSTNPLLSVAKSSANCGLASAEQMAAAQRGAYGATTRREAQWRPEPLVCKRFNVPEPGVTRNEPKKDEKSRVSYSIFSYLESSVHDKDSFAKEQTKFSGSKSLNAETTQKHVENKQSENLPTSTPAVATTSKSTSNSITVDGTLRKISEPSVNTDSTGFSKRLTVAELFLKESEKDLNKKDEGVEVTETINKFDKMDLYKSIFLSDSENEEELPADKSKEVNIDFDELLEGPKNVERNTSPPRGIFANIDFDELNSWRRNTADKKPSNTEVATDNSKKTDEKTSKGSDNPDDPKAEDKDVEENVYGPKIPENLMKRIESIDNFKPVFRSKDKVVVLDESSSSADSWVDVKEVKKRDKKKKSKKHKSKHKKSKHKKKDKYK